jgi:hypothetical protein
MGMVDGIRVLVAELVYNFCYPIVVLGDESIADEAFKLEGAALALVVELIVERFSDVGVHGEAEGDDVMSATLYMARLSHTEGAGWRGRGRGGVSAE